MATLLPLIENRINLCAKSEFLELHLAGLAQNGVAAIEARMRELDSEWSSGRVVASVIAIDVLAGTTLTILVGWPWLILPVVGGLLMLQYLVQRTSWLHSVVQEMGFRARGKIECERLALKALRGDFRNLPTIYDVEDKDAIARLEGEGGIVREPDDAKKDIRLAMKELISATF